MSQRFGGFTASFTKAGDGSVVNFTQLQNVNVSLNMSTSMVRPMGRTVAGAYVNAQGTPSVTFQTRDLLTALESANLTTGLKCLNSAGGGAVFRYQKRSDYGTFETGSVHWQVSSRQGFLFVDSIEADSSSADGAVANMIYIPLSTTGVDDPFVVDRNISFSSVSSPTSESTFYPGPFYMGNAGDGTRYLGPTNRISINPGLNFTPELEDGYIWGRVGVLRTKEPACDITFVRGDAVPELFSGATGAITNSPHGGQYNDSTESLMVFLRRGTDETASGRYPADENYHIAVEIESTFVQVPSWDVSGEDDLTTTVSIRGAGVNDAIASFTQYIPTTIPDYP